MKPAFLFLTLFGLCYCAPAQTMGELQPKDLPALRGMVLEERTNMYVEGASITLVGSNKSATSDKGGKFRILNIPTGYYSIQVTHPDYRSYILTQVQFIENSSLHLIFDLSKGSPSDQPKINKYRLNIPDTTYFEFVEQPPELIQPMPPVQYPEIAKRAGLQGVVWLMLFINEQGDVDKTNVMRGIGGGCDEAAIETAKKIQFVPAKQHGKPVKARVTIPIRFTLTDVSKGYFFGLKEEPMNKEELEEFMRIMDVKLERFSYTVPFRHKLKHTLVEYENGSITDRKFGPGYSTREAGENSFSVLVRKLDDSHVQFHFLGPRGGSSISGLALKSYGATKVAGLRGVRLQEGVETPVFVYAMNPREIEKPPPEGTFKYYLAKYSFVMALYLELERIK